MARQKTNAETNAERRWSEQARRDRERRRVRTRSGRPRGSSTINIHIGGGKRRGRGRGRGRGKAGMGTIFWGLLTSIVSLVAVLTQSLVAVISALTLLGVTVAVAKIEARTARAVAPPPPRQQSRSPGNRRPRPRGGTSGTGRRSGGGKTPVCSEACQVSKRPKSTCRCRATDCKHGSKAGAS